MAMFKRGKRAGTMRDDDDDNSYVWRENLNGPAQGVLAVGIQVGVWLVEHHQEGIAEQPRAPSPIRCLCPADMRHSALTYRVE